VFQVIPATLVAIVVGAVGGGFLGLPFGPLATLFAVAGAVLLGLPVAIWEYKIQDGGGSARDFLK
jgi:uncharacterized membrane protein YoaK (UPF0700 family)